MTWANKMHGVIDVLSSSNEPPPPENVTRLRKGKTRQLDDDDFDDFMRAADNRELQIWSDIDRLLNELVVKYPWRVGAVRGHIKWLRKMAYKRGLKWGKK